MATTTGLMTFAQFAQMPDGGRRFELRHGEPIEVPSPLHEHSRPMWKLFDIFYEAFRGRGRVSAEQGFRALTEYEYRIADVAFISSARWDAIDPKGNLMGSPELVAEVLSPSNTRAEIADKQQLCLGNGCLEFWLIDPKRREVRVSKPEGPSQTYRAGQRIPLLFGGDVALDAIFE